ncbi:MAG: PAS domain-containing sensor histidine kinase [Bacteroidales bacterium]|nr:PAS domain-containing sensor histidine kinase [Bacteroidales bacterium]
MKVLNGESVDFENTLVNYKGQARNIFTSYRPYKHEGIVEGIVVQVLDITDSKKAEEDLRKSEEKYHLLYENMVHGVFYQEKDGALTDINPAGLQIFGLTMDQFRERHANHIAWNVVDENLNLIPSDQYPSVLAKDSGKNVNGVVGVFNPALNEYRWLMVNARPQLTEDKTAPFKVFVTMHDITERKRAVDKLVELNHQLNDLNATKDKLLSIIAHDLRSPFNSIIGYSEMLKGNILSTDDEVIEDQIGRIHQTALDTYYLLENLLAWAKSQTSRLECYPVSIRLDTIIRHCFRMLKPNADQKNISLKLNIPQNLTLEADSQMMRSIIRNLLSNAIKFTRKKGKILISATIENQHFIITIKDNGVGIPPDRLEKIFNKDNYHSTQGTDNEHGSGLGLSICHEFIENHNGSIQIESQVGKGTLVTIKMPVKQ